MKLPLLSPTYTIPTRCNPGWVVRPFHQSQQMRNHNERLGANHNVNHKVFIPITDEMLYDYPQLITAPLQPYKVDNPCYHWMATIESCGQNGQHPVEPIRYFDYRMNLDSEQVARHDSTK